MTTSTYAFTYRETMLRFSLLALDADHGLVRDGKLIMGVEPSALILDRAPITWVAQTEIGNSPRTVYAIGLADGSGFTMHTSVGRKSMVIDYAPEEWAGTPFARQQSREIASA